MPPFDPSARATRGEGERISGGSPADRPCGSQSFGGDSIGTFGGGWFEPCPAGGDALPVPGFGGSEDGGGTTGAVVFGGVGASDGCELTESNCGCSCTEYSDGCFAPASGSTRN